MKEGTDTVGVLVGYGVGNAVGLLVDVGARVNSGGTGTSAAGIRLLSDTVNSCVTYDPNRPSLYTRVLVVSGVLPKKRKNRPSPYLQHSPSPNESLTYSTYVSPC